MYTIHKRIHFNCTEDTKEDLMKFRDAKMLILPRLIREGVIRQILTNQSFRF